MTKPLQELIGSEQDAIEFGFQWPDINMALDQVFSEVTEVKNAIHEHESSTRIQEEVGDLLHAAISVCVFLGYDVNETLDISNKKFSRRMSGLKHIAKERGLNDFQGQSVEFMMSLWREVKAHENK